MERERGEREKREGKDLKRKAVFGERECVCVCVCVRKRRERERERERFANLIRSVLGGSFDCVTEVPLRLRDGGFGSDVWVCEYVCLVEK